MNLTAQQYRDVLDYLIGRIRNIPNQIYLRYPDSFVTCGGIPVTDFDLDHVKYEQDFEFLANSDYELESIERMSYAHMPNDMAKLLLELYRNFIERFRISLDYMFIAYHDYLMHANDVMSTHVTKAAMEEVKRLTFFDPDKDKELFIYPDSYSNILFNADKTRQSWAKQLIHHCSTTMSTTNPEVWNFSAAVYTMMNIGHVLPLEPSEGLSIIDDIDLDEYDVPIINYMPYARSTSSIALSMMFTPEDYVELITDILVALGLIHTSKSNIIFGHPLHYTHHIFINNKVDLVPLINDLLDNPDSWDAIRRDRLTRAMSRLKIIEMIDEFYQEANAVITLLGTQLQNNYIKHLEDEANKLVPPQVVEYHNQYSW